MNSTFVPRGLYGLVSFLAVAVLLFSNCFAAHAQVAGGSILGTVTDPSGAVLANAEITIKDVATGVVRSVSSNSAGFYLAPNLPAGQYDLRITAPGFSAGTATGIYSALAHLFDGAFGYVIAGAAIVLVAYLIRRSTRPHR